MNKVYVLTLDSSVICVSHSIDMIENYLKGDYGNLCNLYNLDLPQYIYEDEFNGFHIYKIKIYDKREQKYVEAEGYRLQVGFENVVDPEALEYTKWY